MADRTYGLELALGNEPVSSRVDYPTLSPALERMLHDYFPWRIVVRGGKQ